MTTTSMPVGRDSNVPDLTEEDVAIGVGKLGLPLRLPSLVLWDRQMRAATT